MSSKSLTIQNTPRLSDSTLLLALTGWMDGGLVSTGTVRLNETATKDIKRV